MLCEPFFTEKCLQYDQNIALIEKEAQYLKNTKLENIFKKYFVNIAKTLNIPEWKREKGLTFQNLDITSDTFSSAIQIKEKTNKAVFIFRLVLPSESYRAILSVNQNE